MSHSIHLRTISNRTIRRSENNSALTLPPRALVYTIIAYRLRWHSTSSTFHHLPLIMRHYAALLYVSLYHITLLKHPGFLLFDWNIIRKLQCALLTVGNPMTVQLPPHPSPLWALLLSSAPEELICACMRACGSGGGCSCVWISNGETEKREPHASVRACTSPRAPQPEVDYHGVNCN